MSKEAYKLKEEAKIEERQTTISEVRAKAKGQSSVIIKELERNMTNLENSIRKRKTK